MTDTSKSLSGPKVFLIGPSGTGKTYSLSTLVDWAQTNSHRVCVLFIEQSLDTLLGAWSDRGKPVPECLYWHQMQTKPLSLAQLTDAANKVGMLSYDALTKLQDPTRFQNNAFEAILKSCASFVDDRTGVNLGSVDSWGPDTIFVIEGLTELSTAAFKMVIGNKPTASKPDYGVAQNNLMNFLRLCTQGLKCGFVLIGHIRKEVDEISGMSKLMASSIGVAIAGDIPPLFQGDTILAVREGAKFTWDTSRNDVDTKVRYLPISAGLPPDFGQIWSKWLARVQAAKPKLEVAK